MAERSIRINVGASVDRTLTTMFPSLEAAAKKARASIQSDMTGAFSHTATTSKAKIKQVERDFEELAKSVSGTAAKIKDPLIRAVDSMSSESRARFSEMRGQFKLLAQDATRSLAQIERAERKASSSGSGGFGKAAGAAASWTLGRGGAYGIAGMGVRAGLGLARDLAGGAGVSFDIADYARKNVELEASAKKISNAGYMPGDVRNGKRVNAEELQKQAFSVGTATGFDPGKVVEGLDKFVAKTGDLQTGRDILQQMATLSRATGSNLEDMVDAAGDVSNALGDVPNKGKVIDQVMRQIAGQGKLGAVEIKDLATQMAKLAASAGQFEGDPAKNIQMMGVLAQESRQRGGSASATQAATSVQSFINMLQTPARAKAFEAATGRSVIGKGGMIRNPEELIIEALRAKGMDPLAFKDIFKNAQGARAVQGFATVYRQAGGGAAGEAAVREEFDRLKESVMDDKQVMDSFAESMNSTEARAQQFNNALQETTKEMQSATLPAFQAVAPVALDLAKGLSSLLGTVLGTKSAEQQKTDVNAELAAQNVLSQGMHAVNETRGFTKDAKGHLRQGKGVVDDAFFDQADERAKALETALTQKQQEIAKDRASGGEASKDDATLKRDMQGGDPFLEADAKKAFNDRQQVERMKEELAQLRAVNQQVFELMRDGLIIKRMPKAPPAADTSHRSGPAPENE